MRRFLIRCMTAGIIAVLLCACGKTGTKPTKEPNSDVTYEKGSDLTGVIRLIDKENSVIVFYNPILDSEETFLYSGATSIQTVHGAEMSIDEVSEGEVYDLYLENNAQTLSRMKATADIVEEEDAVVAVDPDQHLLTVEDQTYVYSDHMIALSDGQNIDPMEITTMDRVTFRGMNGTAYSLIVTKGHGYIEPTEYADFVGGTLTVQGESILPVTEGMLLTVPEGRQTILMRNGYLESTAVAQVKRNQVSTLNMKESMTQKPNTARVTFHIHPEGAEVYINGSMVDVSKPISLYYGLHSIRVVLEGYNTYQGTMRIQDPEPVIRIDLAEEVAAVEENEETGTSDTQTNTEVTADDTTAQTPSDVDYDVDHKISISAPDGAFVYINGTYKGVAPCSFPKCLGQITLTLKRDGYETKSYSMEIVDDSEDTTLSFPELKASS